MSLIGRVFLFIIIALTTSHYRVILGRTYFATAFVRVRFSFFAAVEILNERFEYVPGTGRENDGRPRISRRRSCSPTTGTLGTSHARPLHTGQSLERRNGNGVTSVHCTEPPGRTGQQGQRVVAGVSTKIRMRAGGYRSANGHRATRPAESSFPSATVTKQKNGESAIKSAAFICDLSTFPSPPSLLDRFTTAGRGLWRRVQSSRVRGHCRQWINGDYHQSTRRLYVIIHLNEY